MLFNVYLVIHMCANMGNRWCLESSVSIWYNTTHKSTNSQNAISFVVGAKVGAAIREHFYDSGQLRRIYEVSEKWAFIIRIIHTCHSSIHVLHALLTVIAHISAHRSYNSFQYIINNHCSFARLGKLCRKLSLHRTDPVLNPNQPKPISLMVCSCCLLRFIAQIKQYYYIQ